VLTQPMSADPGNRTAKNVRLRPLAYWELGFNSRRGHGCISLVSVVCVLSGRDLCYGPISRAEESYQLWCICE